MMLHFEILQRFLPGAARRKSGGMKRHALFQSVLMKVGQTMLAHRRIRVIGAIRNRWPVLLIVVMAGCTAPDAAEKATDRAQLFDGMGSHHRTIATANPTAQQYFDQGLIWAFAFNHDEAIRSFHEAARLDPNCAMAWWGVALCNGPHINNPVMTEQQTQAAWSAIQKALALREHATPVERALIDALAQRYVDPATMQAAVAREAEDPASPSAEALIAARRPYDEAYAAAMREVRAAHGGDADVAVLFAESLMDLQPWDLWTKDGQPKGNTEEVLAALEEAMRLSPDHPGALHLYIHAVEASRQPQRAMAAADRLRGLVSASGHLTHMPSHIDVRTGRWREAADQNAAAIEADRRYRDLSPRQSFYRLYMAHNHHFLSYAAMMEGRRETALRAAREMIAGVPEEWGAQYAALVDGYMAIELEVMMRFGLWDDILRARPPAEHFVIARALWRFSRGVAYSAKDEVDAAQREQLAFRAAVKRVPQDALMAINPAHRVLKIADLVLDGEIAYREGRIDDAVASLREAAAIEDDLQYMEPPEWIQPSRHALGAILLDAGRAEEAEAVYREDLARWPENGWSLFGLSRCLKARGKSAEADEVEQRFREVWSRADTRIKSSCLCVKGA